jgi:hypothetical protein
MPQAISEQAFLLTELRYTLGQLHVQLSGLSSDMRTQNLCDGRTIDQVVQEMVTEEVRYQREYASILNLAVAEGHQEQGFVGQDEFERRREQTVAMLEKIGEDWPQRLTDLVKEQVAHDRKSTTEIAECRKSIFAEDQRPDLDEPLTAAKENPAAGEAAGQAAVGQTAPEQSAVGQAAPEQSADGPAAGNA